MSGSSWWRSIWGLVLALVILSGCSGGSDGIAPAGSASGDSVPATASDSGDGVPAGPASGDGVPAASDNGDEAVVDYRFAEFELVEAFLGPPATASTPGLSELPGPDAYGTGQSAVTAPAGRYGPFTVVNGPGVGYAIRYAAGLVPPQPGGLADLEREGLVFEDGEHVVVQWLNRKGGLWTAVLTPVGELPMSDPSLAPVLANMADFMGAATSAGYTISYERLWEDTTLQNRGTGAVTTGDQGESWTATVASDLTSAGSFLTSSWTLTSDGIDDGALSHVESRWTPGAHFVRAGCTDSELSNSGWVRIEWNAQAFANLTEPGYVPALWERLIKPRPVEHGGGRSVIAFSLRRGGLLGVPWPLWSYGDDWETEVRVQVADTGEIQGMKVVSSRGPVESGGPGSDVVDIDFEAWNEPIDIEVPTDVVTVPPWPQSCRLPS